MRTATLLIFLFGAMLVRAGIPDEPFLQEYHDPHPLPTAAANDVRCVEVDTSGRVWASTRAGLFYLAGGGSAVKQKTLTLTRKADYFQQMLPAQEAPDLGRRLELFVDTVMIERMEGTRLLLHHPVDEGEVMPFDKPWEGPFSAYVTVIHDDSLYRLYYRGMPEGHRDGSRREVTCYAESHDGLHWSKPDLGLYEVDGSRHNNVILADAAPVTHNFSPFLDTRSDIPAGERYKALGGISRSGLIAWASPDGIHWHRMQEAPVITWDDIPSSANGPFDSQNVAFWSEHEQKYLCYFRTWVVRGGKKYRSVARAVSDDFLHWEKPVVMDFGDTPPEQLYTNQTAPYFRAPHIYISVAARFMPHRQVLTEQQARALHVDPRYFRDCSDAVLMSSRGGNRYYRTFMEGFVRPGIGLDNWVSRSNYPALNIVQTGPAEMSLYLNQNYAQPTAHLHRYSLRLDGFVSVNAPYRGGEMVTKPFRFRGDTLLINFSTSAAGYIKVEILDEQENPLPGHTLEEAREIIGNEIAKAVAWDHGPSVKALEGKTIRLRFVMKDADLYSFRFK